MVVCVGDEGDRLGHYGRVVAVGAYRVKVEVPGKGGWHYNPAVLTKVERPSNDTERVKLLQEGHGGWNDRMIETFGKVGRVVKVDSDNDMTVHVDGTDWLFNPNSLTRVSSEGGFEAAAEPPTAGESSMCAKGTHQWNKDKCKVCKFCQKCTGYGDKCLEQWKLQLFPGGPCGCGSGEAGCERCGCCRTCAGEDDSSDRDEDISGLMRSLSTRRNQLDSANLLGNI
ncbi:E3 ubiquitin-protein ligase mib1 [Branchiostoma belcheri]|nr:E3 ubiquitin-protein ligase mib1 [Branchiostoma belcheri]